MNGARGRKSGLHVCAVILFFGTLPWGCGQEDSGSPDVTTTERAAFEVAIESGDLQAAGHALERIEAFVQGVEISDRAALKTARAAAEISRELNYEFELARLDRLAVGISDAISAADHARISRAAREFWFVFDSLGGGGGLSAVELELEKRGLAPIRRAYVSDVLPQLGVEVHAALTANDITTATSIVGLFSESSESLRISDPRVAAALVAANDALEPFLMVDLADALEAGEAKVRAAFARRDIHSAEAAVAQLEGHVARAGGASSDAEIRRGRRLVLDLARECNEERDVIHYEVIAEEAIAAEAGLGVAIAQMNVALAALDVSDSRLRRLNAKRVDLEAAKVSGPGKSASPVSGPTGTAAVTKSAKSLLLPPAAPAPGPSLSDSGGVDSARVDSGGVGLSHGHSVGGWRKWKSDIGRSFASLMRGGNPGVDGLEWVKIAQGTYEVGTPEHEVGRDYQLEPTPRAVTVEDYYITTTEVTQASFERFFERDWAPYTGANKPAHSISFSEATAFCESLSVHYPQFVFHIPTEVEWEIAARGGRAPSIGPVVPGEKRHRKWFLEQDLEKLARQLQRYGHFRDNDAGGLAEVGGLGANEVGLFDVHGNVAEWCMREREPLPGYEVPTRQPIRGGSITSNYQRCRAGSRAMEPENARVASIGFRVVCRRNTR